MATLTYIEDNGTAHQVEAPIARTVMQIAIDNSVPGILAECGGACSCGTCHIYVDEAWSHKLPPIAETEAFMLEAVLDPRPTSRLACQLPMRSELDGLVVRLPAEQL